MREVMGERGHIASKIAQLAERQWGHVTRRQLLELGLSARAISRKIGRGELIRVHAGVYAVGHPRPEARARAAAAVLACGEGAVLSHESAAAHWGIRPRWPQRPEVSVPGDRRRPGIRIHRERPLQGPDIHRHQGIRTTSPAQTLLDIAPRLTDSQLVRAVNDARLHAGLRIVDLERLLNRCHGQTGAPALRRAAGLAEDEPTRSSFEDAFLAFARRHGLPIPRVNVVVAGHRVDVLFEDEKVIVELDGRRFHDGYAAFDSDRDRDADTLAAGYVTIRITWNRLKQQPAREAARLHSILQTRRFAGLLRKKA